MQFSKQVDILTKKIKSANSIAILMHNNPDSDALGSAIAISEILRDNFGKDAKLFYSGKKPRFLNFLPRVSEIIDIDENVPNNYFDLLIIVDTAILSKMLSPSGLEVLKSAKFSVKIDHHKDSENFADTNIIEICPSNAEIIYKIAKYANWKISRDAAYSLYTGIFCDTGWLIFFDKSETLKICADLVDLGADPRLIPEQLSTNSRDVVSTNAEIVSNSEFLFDGKLVITQISKKQIDLIGDDASLAMSMLRNIDSVEYLVVIKDDDDNNLRISFRSSRKPVNEIAAKLGGGGHTLAAGVYLKGNIVDIREKIISEFKEILSE